MKRTIVTLLIATVLTLLMATAAFAAYSSPVEILTDLTGKTSEEIVAERRSGQTFGQVAEVNQVLDQFKGKMFAYKQAVIEQRVSEGKITEEKATAVKELMGARMAECQGSPTGEREKLELKFGGGLGFNKGETPGARDGNGNGFGRALHR